MTAERCKKMVAGSYLANHIPETKAKRSTSIKKLWQDPEYRKKLTDIHRLLWQNLEYRSKVMAAISTEEVRAKMGKATTCRLLESWQDPEYRAKMSQALSLSLQANPEARHKRSEDSSNARLRDWQKPEYRKIQSTLAKKRWLNPDYIQKVLNAVNAKPNKIEARIIKICIDNNLDFKYNGDFSLGVTLNGLIPDLVNVNGKKQVIEILGDYFHSPKVVGKRKRGTAEGKIEVYSELGFKCLILWEREINAMTDEQIHERITQFSRGASHG